MRAMALIVMEPGSAWPKYINRRAVDIVALGQPCDETPRDLARKACERVARLTRAPELAILACNADVHDEATERRVTILRSLLLAVNPRAGHVVLCTGRDASPDLRAQLLALVAALRESLFGSSASVSVRFDAGEPLRRPHRPRRQVQDHAGL